MGLFVFGWSEFAGALAAWRKRVQMLVAYRVEADGRRQLLAFLVPEAEVRPIGGARLTTCITGV